MNRIISARELGVDQMTLLPSTGQFINVHGDRTFLSTVYPSDKFIPMQFTGLLDKNGKEIYEGDIIRCSYPGGENDVYVHPVVFENSAFRIPWAIVGDALKDSWEVEVIGNIYENPELLK